MTWKRRAAALLLGVLMLFTSAPVVMPVFAGGGESESAGTAVISNIHTAAMDPGDEDENPQTKQDEVWQGDIATISFQFQLAPTGAESFSEGDKVVINTNIGQFFSDANEWKSFTADIKQEQADGTEVVIAVVTVTADTMTFTITKAGEGLEMQGVCTLPVVTANDVGATKENPIIAKTLEIGDGQQAIQFHWVQPTPPPSGDSISVMDMDTFWKNGWTIGNYIGASINLEVNPIGSMDLYGSTTFQEEHETTESYNQYPRTPKKYQTLMIEDPIPEHGFIDESTIQVYACIPVLKKNTGENWNDEYHGNYSVPNGVYYAQAASSQWYRVD